MFGWDAILGDRVQQGYIGLAIIVGTGLATATFSLSHASQADFGPGEAVYVFTPVVVSIALVVSGALIWADGFDGPEMIRVGAAVFLGMAVFGLLVTWTITHEFIRGGSVAHAPFVTVNSMSVGGFVGLILGWFDARKRRTEARLERERNKFKQRTEELDEFAGIVSHDLRNPLNVAKLQLENAQGMNDPTETQDALTDVEDSLRRMERIIDDVLGMVREGQAIDEVEPVSLATVAEHSWGNVKTHGATLEVVQSGRVQADRSALEHILENLFRNSIEHGTTQGQSVAEVPQNRDGGPEAPERQSPGTTVVEDGGGCDLTVRVGTLEDGFYVEDTGTGIPAEIRETLFDTGVTTNDDGTGLGLSIVQKLVNAHDWDIRATEAEGGGARFEITGVEFGTNPADSWLSTLD